MTDYYITYYSDNSDVFDANWWNLWKEKWGITWNLPTGPNYEIRGDVYGDELYQNSFNMLNDYMNFPWEQLQLLKKMAGIEWLAGEENFNYNDYHVFQDGYIPSTNINKSTIYRADGGYPYGSGKNSYYDSVTYFSKPYNNNSYNYFNFKNSSYCSPAITLDNPVKCENGFYRLNTFDATGFNIQGDSKTYTNNMYCKEGQSAMSCLRPGYSPGSNNGIIEPDSRHAFCVNKDNPNDSNDLMIHSDSTNKCHTKENTLRLNTDLLPEGVLVVSVVFSGESGRLLSYDKGGSYYNIQINQWRNKLINKNISPNFFDMSPFIQSLISAYKSELDINLPGISEAPTLDINVGAISLDDPGLVNNTTRPPINIECSIKNYPIEIKSCKQFGNNIEINFIINKY